MPGRVIQLAWRLVDRRPGDTELRVQYELHDYLQFESLSVSETAETVEIAVYGRLAPPEGGWTAYSEPESRTVTLDEPLGDRALTGSGAGA